LALQGIKFRRRESTPTFWLALTHNLLICSLKLRFSSIWNPSSWISSVFAISRSFIISFCRFCPYRVFVDWCLETKTCLDWLVENYSNTMTMLASPVFSFCIVLFHVPFLWRYIDVQDRSHAIPLFVSANVSPLNMLYLKQYVLLNGRTRYLPISRFWISVIFLLVHLTSKHITLEFLMLVIYMLIYQDWEFNLIHFPISELSCGIVWSLSYVNLGKHLSKIKFINFYLRYLVMRMIMLMSLS